MSVKELILSIIILFPPILGVIYIITQAIDKKNNLQSRIEKILEGRMTYSSSKTISSKGPSEQTLIEKKLKQYFMRNPKKAEKFNLWFYQSGLKLELKTAIIIFILSWCLITLIAELFLKLNIFLIIIGTFIGQFVLLYGFIEYKISRQKSRMIEELPHAVDIIARSIKAGSTIEKAFSVVAREIKAPLKEEFVRILHELEFGISFEKVMHSAAHRVNIPDFFFFISAIIIQRRSGGGLYEVLENIVTTLHKTKEIRMKIKVFSAESKGSAMVLTSIPIFLWVVIMRVNPGYLDFFLYDTLGRKFLILLFGLIAATIISVKKIIKFEV